MGATIATATTILGIVGVIVTTPSLCPESVSPARCSAAGSKAALIAAYGLTAAGAAGPPASLRAPLRSRSRAR